MGKIRLRKKIVISTSDKIVLIISLVLIILFFLMKYISNNITPVFLNYATIEARKFIGAVINKAITETKIDEDL